MGSAPCHCSKSTPQVAAIVNDGAAIGWRPMPIPEEVMAKLPYNNAEGKTPINIPFELSNGYFLCKTAGSDVLTASGQEVRLCEEDPGDFRCSEPVLKEDAPTSDQCKRRFGDQILGVLDLESYRLYTFVASTY